MKTVKEKGTLRAAMLSMNTGEMIAVDKSTFTASTVRILAAQLKSDGKGEWSVSAPSDGPMTVERKA